MKRRVPNTSELALIDLLSCEQSEIKKHSQSVYEWRGLYFEVVTKDQRDRGGVPESWYSKIGEFYFREMGKKSEKVKKILKK